MVGRPKKPKNHIKIGYSINLTKEQKYAIDERAIKKGMTFSQYVRSVLFPITPNDCSTFTEKQKLDLAKNLVCPICEGSTVYANRIDLIRKKIILYRMCLDCHEPYELIYKFLDYEEFESFNREINESNFLKTHLELFSNSIDDLLKQSKKIQKEKEN